jgi:hypothetical protein
MDEPSDEKRQPPPLDPRVLADMMSGAGSHMFCAGATLLVDSGAV